MKSVLEIIVLAFGLAACTVDADSARSKLSTVAADVSVPESDSTAAIDETFSIDESATTSGCVQVWECRSCGDFRTQNILVDACTGEVIRTRRCGEPCF